MNIRELMSIKAVAQPSDRITAGCEISADIVRQGGRSYMYPDGPGNQPTQNAVRPQQSQEYQPQRCKCSDDDPVSIHETATEFGYNLAPGGGYMHPNGSSLHVKRGKWTEFGTKHGAMKGKTAKDLRTHLEKREVKHLQERQAIHEQTPEEKQKESKKKKKSK